MAEDILIDPDTIGQMVVEGLAIIQALANLGDGYDLNDWLKDEHKRGNTLIPLQQLAQEARDMLEEKSILHDASKHIRVSVTYSALSGLLSCYGIEV